METPTGQTQQSNPDLVQISRELHEMNQHLRQIVKYLEKAAPV